MIAGAGAGDVKQMALAVVDFFEVGFVADVLDALLGRDDLIGAGHYYDDAEFQPFRQMHRAHRQPAHCDLDLVTQLNRGGAPHRSSESRPSRAIFLRDKATSPGSPERNSRASRENPCRQLWRRALRLPLTARREM